MTNYLTNYVSDKVRHEIQRLTGSVEIIMMIMIHGFDQTQLTVLMTKLMMRTFPTNEDDDGFFPQPMMFVTIFPTNDDDDDNFSNQ